MREFETRKAPVKKSGGLNWLYVFAGLGATFWLGLGVIVLIAYKSDDKTARTVDTLGDTWVGLFTSQYKPEIMALKEIGCESANLLVVRDAAGVDRHRVLTCQVMPWSESPTCKRAADEYLKRADASNLTLSVQVQKMGRECFEHFDSEGEPFEMEVPATQAATR